jgi:predicted CoA-binding protein
MKDTILDFLEQKNIAIVGASPNKDNFGRSLMTELAKKDIECIPVNPAYEEVLGRKCVATVADLPDEVSSAILTNPPSLTDEVVAQCVGTGIKRIWMIKGVGRGNYSESASKLARENGIEVVYGFCPLMFFGGGMHQFHFWLRKTFGKMPEEYMASVN